MDEEILSAEPEVTHGRPADHIARPRWFERVPRARRTAVPPAEATIGPTSLRPGKLIVARHDVILGESADQLWEVYRENFAPLEAKAVLQHLYSRREILTELANPRITKVVGWQDGRPVGLAMVTADLEAVPQISPRYLRARYPEHAARSAIHFGILLVVSPAHRGKTLFARLCTELYQITGETDGVLVFDVCSYNREKFDSDAIAQRLARQFPGASVHVIDQQTWYAAELPRPLPPR